MWKKSEPVSSQHPVGLREARLEEGQVVVEAIGIASRAERGGPVALALEADPVALGVTLRPERDPRLAAPGVEGRIDIDQVDAASAERAQDLQVVLEDDPQHRPALFRVAHDGPKVAQGRPARNAAAVERGVSDAPACGRRPR